MNSKNIVKKKNIKNVNKIINVMKNLEDIDLKLEKKNKRCQKDIAFCNKLLEESKNNFVNIIKNLN